MRVLNIGPGQPNYNIVKPEDYFDGVEDLIVETLDIDPSNNPDYVHDIRDPLPEDLHNRYDYILASHVLEHVEFWKSGYVIRNIAQALKVGAEIAIVVPSMEWACRQLLMDRYTIGVMGVFYGGQQDEWDYHRTGYTIASMRMLLEQVGLLVKKAYSSVYASVVHGKTEYCGQNVFVALKHKEIEKVAPVDDPSTALS